MKIQDVAKLCHIPASKIRFYEEQQLITIPRDENGYRIFDEEVINHLKLIVGLKNLDFTLSDIRYIMSLFKLKTSPDCNNKSKAYWEELIVEVEEELKHKLYVLQKLKEVYQLSSNDTTYQSNKEEIIKIILQEED